MSITGRRRRERHSSLGHLLAFRRCHRREHKQLLAAGAWPPPALLPSSRSCAFFGIKALCFSIIPLQNAPQVVVAVARTVQFYIGQSEVQMSAQTQQQVMPSAVDDDDDDENYYDHYSDDDVFC